MQPLQSVHIGDAVIVDYSHRLNVPYALEIGGQQYLLPEQLHLVILSDP